MNKLTHEQRVQAVNCLIEGCSIRATVRMTGIAKKTVMRLPREVGEVCEFYQDQVLRNLHCRRIQVGELWGFNYCKAKNVTPDIAAKVPNAGDVWLWVAIDPESKLVPCWTLGTRGTETAFGFVHDLKDRLANRVQLTSDGHRVYLEAVESAFGSEVDYAMLVKIFGRDTEPDTHYARVHRMSVGRNLWQSESETYQHEHGRAAELERPYSDAALHSAVKWIFAQD